MGVLESLREVNAKRANSIPKFKKTMVEWSLGEWGNAVAGETGEMCNIIKKITRGDFSLDDENRKKELSNEMADIICYLDLLAHKSGINLSEAIVNKFNSVSEKMGSDIKL